MSGQTLVAGVGNIFLGDDGFGPEVARRLAQAALPDGVRVADYGTSGMHLAYDLASGYDTAILVDAAPRGEPPGTVTLLEAVLARGGDPPEPLAHSPAQPGHAVLARGGDPPEPPAHSPAQPGHAVLARGGDPPEPPAHSPAQPGHAVLARGGDPPEPPAHSPAQPGHAFGAPGIVGEYDPVEISRFFDGHGMPPDVVLSVLGMLGGQAVRILVVCCEPASIDYRMELSEPVAAAVDDAVRIISGLVAARQPPAAAARPGHE